MGVNVRPYEKKDRKAVRRIFLETAFHGSAHHHFFEDGEWLADAMTYIYTDVSPKDTFVAEENGEVIGYLTGTLNTIAYDSLWTARVLPRLIVRFITGGSLFRTSTWRFFFHSFVSFLKGEQGRPGRLNSEYPAHLHINLTAKRRGKGTGSELIKVFLTHARSNGSRGVHLRTASVDWHQYFFESLGFKPLKTSKLTLWNYLGQPPYFLITYGLSLKSDGKKSR